MTDNTECRKDFEEWLARKACGHPSGAKYFDDVKPYYWVGWQEAWNTRNDGPSINSLKAEVDFLSNELSRRDELLREVITKLQAALGE